MRENEFDLDTILAEFDAEVGSAPQPDPEPEPQPVYAPAPEPVYEPEEAAPKARKPSRPVREPLVEPPPVRERAQERPKKRKADRRRPFLSFLLTLLLALCLAFSAVNLHPAVAVSAGRGASAANQGSISLVRPSTPTPTLTPLPADTPAAVPSPAVSAEPTATPVPTPEPTPEPIHYVIPEGTLVAPAPQLSGFHSYTLDEADKVMELIARARDCGLLREDETVAFSPAVNFYRGGDAKNILCYFDETILVILWKEEIDGNCVTYTEIKVADGSQFRRKLADDSFGAGTQYFASELARSSNAVVAMNADFYLFRDLGMVVYNRELFRLNTWDNKYNSIDTLFVTAGGDFLYKRVGEWNDWDSITQFIADNDVVFSIAFGPVLVENGEAVPCAGYPVGEVNSGYSRAGIGQVDKLHYLYMAMNHSPEKAARWTVSTFAQHFAEKPVFTAYCLDGGQTGEVVFQGEAYNHVDFGSERLVSDIIYFASALPQEGGVIG